MPNVTENPKKWRGATMFSGIGTPELALPEIEWQWCAEIDRFASRVLKHRHPGIVNLGSVTELTPEKTAAFGPLDIIVFGSPCQDLSVAGKRAGLQGERSGLFFRAMDIVRWTGARFALWENVPGAFSTNGGRDFALVVGEMVGVEFGVPGDGWGNSGVAVGPDGLLEWCVLDAQYFGVPQRRRRIFALRDSGNWRDRPPILLEPESLQGYPAPRRETGKSSPTLSSSGAGVSRVGGFGGGVSEPEWMQVVDAVAFNAYQRTVGDVTQPITTGTGGLYETGVITGVLQIQPRPSRVAGEV